MEVLKPIMRMIETNKARIIELKEDRERLITAYAAGVLSLDEIAHQKEIIEKQISDLNGAVVDLEGELKPRLLDREDIETLETYAVKIRGGADLTDPDPQAQREIYRLLDMQVILGSSGGQKRADIRCILGEDPFPTNNNTILFIEKKSAK